MSYHITIQDTQTGEIRFYYYPLEWEDSSDYLWCEGNYACDCNRAQFFASVEGEPDPNYPCNTLSDNPRFVALAAYVPGVGRIPLEEA